MARKVKNDDYLAYIGLGAQINGDNVVGMTAPKKVKGIQGYGDRTNVLAYLTSDEDRKETQKHLGLIELFNTTHDVQVPIHLDLVKNLQVLEIDPEGSVTYDINIPQDSNLYAEVLTEVENESLFAQQPIRVVFDRAYTAGDRLTPDPTSRYQVRVSREHPVVPFGEGFMHIVFWDSNDSKKTFPAYALTAGTKWVKLGNPMAEYSTQWSGVTMGATSPGVLNMAAVLPSPQGIETAYTVRGGNIRSKAATELSKQTVNFLETEMAKLGGFEKAGAMFTGRTDAKGQIGVTRVASTLEYLAMKELFLMNSYTNTFAIASEEHTEDGVVRINEGVWHQARRGKIVSYARPGAFGVNHMKEISRYIYGNTGIEADARVLRFRGGWEFYNNVLQVISDYALSTTGAMQPILGTDSLIKSPFTGTNDNLELGVVKIKSAIINGVGRVYVEHDKSFDYKPIQSGMENDFVTGGFNKTTYSGILDAYDSIGESKGNFTGAKLVEGGNLRSNFFYLKPDDGTHFFYGHNTGRAPFQGASTDLRASLRYMGHEFFASMRSWIMMVDATSHVIIELQDTYVN